VIAGLQDQLDSLDERMTRLEAREGLVIVEAKAAAGAAETVMIADLARRVGVAEGRAEVSEQLKQPRRKPIAKG
jgi:hypothetical protein